MLTHDAEKRRAWIGLEYLRSLLEGRRPEIEAARVSPTSICAVPYDHARNALIIADVVRSASTELVSAARDEEHSREIVQDLEHLAAILGGLRDHAADEASAVTELLHLLRFGLSDDLSSTPAP